MTTTSTRYLSARPNFVQYLVRVFEMDGPNCLSTSYEASVVRHADRTGCDVGVSEYRDGQRRAFRSFEFEDCPGNWRAAERVAMKAVEAWKELRGLK